MEIKFKKVVNLDLEIGDMFIDADNNAFLFMEDLYDDYAVVDLQNSLVGYYKTIDAIFNAYDVRRVIKNENIVIEEKE